MLSPSTPNATVLVDDLQSPRLLNRHQDLGTLRGLLAAIAAPT
jgi:hypothetical protein